MCADTILRGREEKRNVLLCTWLVSRKQLENIFGGAVFITERLNLFEWFQCFTNKLIYAWGKEKPYTNIKALIFVNRLNPEQIEKLEKFSTVSTFKKI